MAANTKEQRDALSDSLAQFQEAARHQMTASRLAMAGAVALGTAATVYFMDEQRRNAFLDQTRRWSDQLTALWGQSTGENQATQAG